MQTILGIDPGSNITGFGVIRKNGKVSSYLDSGSIKTCNKDRQERLAKIFTELAKIIELYKPDVAAIERIFVHRNVNSALKLGEARGVALAALAMCKVPVNEYSARQVKQSVVGFGGAEKSQVEHMVKTLLHVSGASGKDETDALAIALCHAHHSTISELLQKKSSSLTGKAGSLKIKNLPTSWRKLKIEELIKK